MEVGIDEGSALLK